MANPEHLAILQDALAKDDIEIWNQWRRKKPRVLPNLRSVNLREADLKSANLRSVNLREADLKSANLRSVNLREADLREADLREADLRLADLRLADLSVATLSAAKLVETNLGRTNLRAANLREADLRKADLKSANLREADLRLADLSVATLSAAKLVETNLGRTNLRAANLRDADIKNTDFNQARCWDTIFVNVDLSQAQNLSSVRHFGPSSIGIDTLYQSGGNIPREFLEGCGVPEPMITYARSLVGQMIEFNSCFISYSSKDEEFAQYLYGQMKSKGLRVWYAPEDMKYGRKVHEQLYEAIHLHDRFLLILSEHSLQSNWVKTEIKRARKREREEGRQILFPISLMSFEALLQWELIDADEGSDLAQEVREYFIGDFSTWKDHDAFQPLFQKLVASLRKS